MKKIVIFALVLSLIFALGACNMQGEENSGSLADKTDISDESNVSVPEKLPDGAFKIDNYERENYAIEDDFSFKITVDSDEKFKYKDDYYVEYLDKEGIWQKCEKEFDCSDREMTATREAELSFILSDRVVPGKEAYRIVMNISVSDYTYTVYSSNFYIYEKLPDGAIKITTDKEHYSFDDTLTFKITVDSDGEFTYGREARVQYLDENGDWKTSEKGFYFTEDAFLATFESEYSFPVSERADPGKEKYRIILKIHHRCHSYTVYSNEFSIE